MQLPLNFLQVPEDFAFGAEWNLDHWKQHKSLLPAAKITRSYAHRQQTEGFWLHYRLSSFSKIYQLGEKHDYQVIIKFAAIVCNIWEICVLLLYTALWVERKKKFKTTGVLPEYNLVTFWNYYHGTHGRCNIPMDSFKKTLNGEWSGWIEHWFSWRRLNMGW